jgi:hypothetical protein
VGGSFDPEAEVQSLLLEIAKDAVGTTLALLMEAPMEGSPPPDEMLELVAYDEAAEAILWRTDTEIAAAGVQPFLQTPTDRRAFTAPVAGPGGRIYLGHESRLYAYAP